MSEPKFVVFGLLVALASLWGGAYVLQFLADTWMAFPAFMTSFVIGIGGVITAVYGGSPK